MYGCDKWAYGYGRAFGVMAIDGKVNCNNPQGLGWIAVIYFVSFCVLGSQVLLTLFIGIIATSMEEVKAKYREEAKVDKRIALRAKYIGIDNLKAVLPFYRKIFDYLDDGGDGTISKEEFKQLIPVLTQLRKVSTLSIFQAFCCSLHFIYIYNGSNTLGTTVTRVQ